MMESKVSQGEVDQQFYMLANLMPTLCWMAAADGWIFWYNSRWYEFTGTTPAEMKGWGWQSVHDPAVLPSVMEAWTESIRTGQPFEMTFPLKSAAGTYRPFLTRVTPVQDASGQVVRWLGVNTDIGDERAALEMREQFMAVLGHDLRNPLQALTAGLTVLRKTATDDKSQRMIAMMRQSTARMGALIDDVMDMARARLGVGIQLTLETTQPLEPTLRNVIAELASVHPERQIDVVLSLPTLVECDHGRIAQLLSNLLGNALTYGSTDQPIVLQAHSDDHQFSLSVANGGEPISPEEQERLFQPFFRGAVRPSRQGLGLGLYIAHEIARAHRGSLTVDSTPAQTCFTFRMPVKFEGCANPPGSSKLRSQ